MRFAWLSGRSHPVLALCTAALGGALTAVSLDARAECTKDIECKGDRICSDGACVDPPRPEADSVRPPAPVAAPARSPDFASDTAPGEPRNRPMMNAGIGLTVAGAATFVAAVVLTIDAAVQIHDYNTEVAHGCPSSFACSAAPSRPTGVIGASTVLWLLTPTLLGPGIPLWIVGGRRVPASAENERRSSLALDRIDFDGRRVVVGFRF
jgi:hypothetical protein